MLFFSWYLVLLLNVPLWTCVLSVLACHQIYIVQLLANIKSCPPALPTPRLKHSAQSVHRSCTWGSESYERVLSQQELQGKHALTSTTLMASEDRTMHQFFDAGSCRFSFLSRQYPSLLPCPSIHTCTYTSLDTVMGVIGRNG